MADGDDGEWRFSLSDLPDEEGEEEDPEGESEEGGNVAGSIAGLDEELEPGRPSLENAFFVLLGVLVTLLVIVTMAGVV